MSEKLQWDAVVNGETYLVECITMKTLFEIYVDGELAMKVSRKMKNDDEDSEYDLRIGGKRCQFVLYDGVPDLCVDGILLGVEREMARKERRNRWLKILGGMLVIIMSTYATFLWFVYEIGGDPIFGGLLTLGMILFFFVCGILLLISAIRRKKEY